MTSMCAMTPNGDNGENLSTYRYLFFFCEWDSLPSCCTTCSRYSRFSRTDPPVEPFQFPGIFSVRCHAFIQPTFLLFHSWKTTDMEPQTSALLRDWWVSLQLGPTALFSNARSTVCWFRVSIFLIPQRTVQAFLGRGRGSDVWPCASRIAMNYDGYPGLSAPTRMW